MKYLGKIQDNKDLVTKEYVDNADSGKVDKVSGKGLSTNDYTTAEKNKLAGIAAGAQVNTITGVKGNSESSYRTGNVNITAANVGAASSDYYPNDVGEIKTRYRVANKGYAAQSNTPQAWYYPVAKFPQTGTGNYASLIVSGRIGGWESGNMSSISALIWNRNSTGIALLDIAGSATSMNYIWNLCDIVVYKNSDQSETIYLKCYSYFTYDLDFKLYQSTATFLYDGSYTTSPSGTLTAQASTSARRVEIIDGKLLVNGVDLSVISNLSGILGGAHGGTGASDYLSAFTNLEFRGRASDLNNALSRGVYRYDPYTANIPFSNSYGVVLVLLSAGNSHNNLDNWIWQLSFNTSNRRLYVRKKINANAWDNWSNLLNSDTVNGYTVEKNVPSNAVFTDTVTTATTSGSGNAVTAITATNGALSVTKGTTFLTSHQDISGKADKSATVSTVAWDSTNKKLTKTINGTTTDVVTAATLRTGLNVADGAEVNQNAFSNVKVGSTTVAADSKTDTLELVAGSNVTLTPDATNDKVTIAATDTTYESKAAASGGTAVSLVTTGEKYTWNHKMSSIADVTNMELLTYEGTTNDVMTVGLHDDDATSKIPVVNATTGKIPASVYNNTTYESKEAASGGTAVSLVTTGEKYTWNNKQATLVSGTNIKTINNTSLLGSGNINVGGGGGTTDYSDLSNKPQINSNTLSGNKTSADLGLQSALSTSSPAPTVSATKGTKVSAEMRKYGNIIQFTLTFKNTSSVGSGSNVFEGTLSTNKPLQTISACGYYSSNALPMSINSSGSIVVRNAGSAAVTCSSNTTIGATWLV